LGTLFFQNPKVLPNCFLFLILPPDIADDHIMKKGACSMAREGGGGGGGMERVVRREGEGDIVLM